jgi:DNA-binding CsgD family transcriptional regulator
MPSIVEHDRDILEQNLRQVTADNPVIATEHRVTMPDGRIVWQRWSHRGLFDKDGRLVEFQAVGSDITARRAVEERTRAKAVAATQIRNLTARERDVMRLVVAGDANKVSARTLDLSIKTIEKHRSRLMRKLRVRSVPELVKLALLAEPADRRKEHSH